MPVAKLRACSTSDAMKPEQKVCKTDKEGHDSIDSFIRQAIGKEPFFPFTKASESPVQWIQLLHALDQQGVNTFPNVTKVDNAIEGKERLPEHSNGVTSLVYEKNGFKESTHATRAGGLTVKGTKSTPEHIQSLKIPEAVVALAQAAAKANDSEKYLPGWPLLSPLKVQMQRCEKCSREFCSSINYRRHIRVHRRPLNIDKDSTKYRESLGTFWDKLSLDEAMEIVSLKNASLEEVAGSSLITALSSLSRKHGFSSLPQTYVKAGDTLLDIVQARPSRFPISSQELFTMLDDASEKTFLCAGTATSVQKFVFDGEAGKICLEMKNLIACTSFLVEQKLVDAWLADMNAEALRRQNLLVEEEEANQKRQAELLEKKRLKKLRQKAQKGKDGDKGPLENAGAAASSSAVSHADIVLESDQNSPEAPGETVQICPEAKSSLDANVETHNRCCFKPDTANISAATDSANDQNGICGDRVHAGNSQRQVSHWMVPKPLRNITNGSHSGQVLVRKYAIMQKQNSHREHQKCSSSVNSHKVWTRKAKCESEGRGFNSNGSSQRESIIESEQNSNHNVLIGSICVTLGSCNGQETQDNIAVAASDQFAANILPVRNDNIQERLSKPDLGPNGMNRPTVKLWRPVSSHENRGDSVMFQVCKRGDETNGMSGRNAVRVSLDEICVAHDAIADTCSGRSEGSLREAGEDLMGIRPFSSSAAEAFLAQRWKEAIAAEHVKLVLSAETELSEFPEVLDGPHLGEPVAPDSGKTPGIAENWHPELGPPVAASYDKPKFSKAEKGCRLKYIPKQKSAA